MKPHKPSSLACFQLALCNRRVHREVPVTKSPAATNAMSLVIIETSRMRLSF